MLNDIDIHRTGNGLAAWVNEQALREIYLKPFELVAKNALMTFKYQDSEGQMHEKTIRANTALMATYTRIGSKADAGHKALGYVLREEWGFLGTVITDSNVTQHTHVEECMAFHHFVFLLIAVHFCHDDCLWRQRRQQKNL